MVKQEEKHKLHRHNDKNAVLQYTILNSNGKEIPEVDIFLKDVFARTSSLDTLRTYRDAIFDYLRYLAASKVPIKKVRRKHIVDYIIHLKTKINPQRGFPASGIEPGSVNDKTKKAYLANGYQARTLNLRKTVIGLFFDVLILNEMGPMRHPIVRATPRFRTARKFEQPQPRSLRQKVPVQTPVMLPDQLIDEMMHSTTCLRDHALIEGFKVSAARANELLNLQIGDILWAESKILLKTKGRPGKEPVQVTQKFLALTQQYLAERGEATNPHDPVWLMQRGPTRQLTYTALRAVFRRLNAKLNSNVTAHNFRSTCASKLARVPGIQPLKIQKHLRHANFASTQIYIKTDMNLSPDELINLDDIMDHTATPKVHAAFDSAALARVLRGT